LLKRLFFSTADRLEVDKAGRILIPLFLRQDNFLDGETIIVGMGDHFEIWAKAVWDSSQASQLKDSDANSQRFKTLDI
jgi:MraZ protein